MASSGLADLQILEKVTRYLSTLRPFLLEEGSDLAVRDCQAGVVTLVVKGSCVGCALAGTDFNQFRKEMEEDIPGIKDVIFTNPFGIPVA
ncbi:MAG: NifU family protein [Bacilli bacterium]|jgi:Fe-S cluster biogenesis protein NfuA|nr:NifU family protein [Bacilli bacterium]